VVWGAIGGCVWSAVCSAVSAGASIHCDIALSMRYVRHTTPHTLHATRTSEGTRDAAPGWALALGIFTSYFVCASLLRFGHGVTAQRTGGPWCLVFITEALDRGPSPAFVFFCCCYTLWRSWLLLLHIFGCSCLLCLVCSPPLCVRFCCTC
jgi:hypothetical protein